MMAEMMPQTSAHTVGSSTTRIHIWQEHQYSRGRNETAAAATYNCPSESMRAGDEYQK